MVVRIATSSRVCHEAVISRPAPAPSGAGRPAAAPRGSRHKGRAGRRIPVGRSPRSEEHTSELQSPCNLVCRLLLEKKKKQSEMIKIYYRTNGDVKQAEVRCAECC